MELRAHKPQKEDYVVNLFEAHSWDVGQFLKIETAKNSYRIEIITNNAIKVEPYAIYLIADQLCTTRLPLFFPRDRRVALLKESPIHTREMNAGLIAKRFDLVLTHRKDLIELGTPFKRLDFSSNWVQRDPQGYCTVKKSKLVSFIGSVCHETHAGYTFRKAVAKQMLQWKDIDCFGRGIRAIEYKTAGLRDYCFSVAMENTREDYYYTEKLIDCLLSEVVPIYWGCPDIGSIFDKRGMITFESETDLNAILDTLTFERYEKMRPYIEKNKNICIARGLDSYSHYLQRCLEAIEGPYIPLQNKLSGWQVSKGMAGLRLAAQYVQPRRRLVTNK